MRRIGNLEIKPHPVTFSPEMHIKLALPMEVLKDSTLKIDPQKFYDDFVELLKIKVKYVEQDDVG